MKILFAIVLVLAACDGQHRAARERYNAGVEALQKGEHDQAQKLLLEARSGAGVDPELRFHAAFNLGVAFAAQAEKVKQGEGADLAQALGFAQQALSWFADAARLDPSDAGAQSNVSIMRARVQALTDELRKEEGSLEARLEAIIGDQRGVLDEARDAWLAIKQAGGSDPLAQQGLLSHLADRERGVVAEAGVISDLAADEIDTIAKKPDDKRTDEEKARLVQLKALDVYIQDARSKIAEARRKLQDLAAEHGVDRAEAALVALKRAREQLLDPVTVLQGLLQDQLELARDTVSGGAGAKLLDRPADAMPAWLMPAALAARQSGVRERLGEISTRLFVAVERSDPSQAGEAQDPEQAKTLERVRAAMPAVQLATTAMGNAHDTLAAGKLDAALAHERTAIEALGKAIEMFSDLRQTIELAYGEQQRVGKLLDPEAAKQLDPAERGRETRGGVARNVERVERLKALIADALAEARAPGEGGKAPDEQKLEAAKQQLGRAEELRAQALHALGELAKALDKGDPMPHAKEADAKLKELRELFFSVIEHLKQLIRDQGDTRDQTSAIAGADPIARAPKLPGLVTREDEHAAIAKAITEALAKQADEAAKQPQQPQQPGQPPQPQQHPDAKTLSDAAAEVRLAEAQIADARGVLVKARDATTSSENVKPAVEHQAQALVHLENALKLLQPPSKQKQKQQQQDQQDQQQQQQQQSAASAGQRAREMDAQQQKKRQKQAPDPVEKDW